MKKRNITIIILGILFIINTILVVTNQYGKIDDSIYNFLFGLRNPYLDWYFMNITKLGNVLTIIIIVLILTIFFPKKEKVSLLTITISTVICNNVIKYIIQRERPSHLRLIKESGYSYPSGHSMISIAVYGFLIYIVNRKIENKIIKILLITLLTIIILSIGLSRIYVGVHYPSDVIGGFILALIIEWGLMEIINRYIGGKENDKNDCK